MLVSSNTIVTITDKSFFAVFFTFNTLITPFNFFTLNYSYFPVNLIPWRRQCFGAAEQACQNIVYGRVVFLELLTRCFLACIRNVEIHRVRIEPSSRVPCEIFMDIASVIGRFGILVCRDSAVVGIYNCLGRCWLRSGVLNIPDAEGQNSMGELMDRDAVSTELLCGRYYVLLYNQAFPSAVGPSEGRIEIA